MGPRLNPGRAESVSNPLSRPLTFTENMLAGAIARGVAQTILHPVDVVRTRLQARDIASNWRPGVFFKGVIPQITLAIPAGAVQFVAFETAKDKLASLFPDDKLQQVRILVAGAFGALAAASFRVPQEVLKQRVQADLFPNVLVAVRETIKADGLGGLYKGWLATISRDIPWNALSFMFHGQGKRMFMSVKRREPANNENLSIAGVAGAIAAVIMTPVDVVKTRLMTQRMGSAQYSGILSTLKKIVAEEGAGTLMKGVVPRIIFLAPLAGVTFSVYDAVTAKIRKRKEAAGNLAAETKHEQQKSRLRSMTFSSQSVRFLGRRGHVLASRALQRSACPARDTLADYSVPTPIFFTA